MENIIFFDSEDHNTLLPLTYTRPVSELRVGIYTISKKWEKRLRVPSSNYTQPYLEPLFPMHLSNDNLFILGGLLPTTELIHTIKHLEPETALIKDGWILASRGATLHSIKQPNQTVKFEGTVNAIQRPWDIFTHNAQEIENDIELIEFTATAIPDHVTVHGDVSRIFIHPSAKVHAHSLNATDGPIYIGEQAEVMEGSMVRGPFALCKNSVLKMGAKIYGATTIGPESKVGGEVNNCVIQGHTNKGHDGFIGNSVIGEWCNLGADTNSSNLKNNYSDVRVWDYLSQTAIGTELTFCGLIMGDHAKTGINSMLNTGTVVGVGANVYGANFPPKFIPSFSWGSGVDFAEHDFEKFCSTAEHVMMRRGVAFSVLQRDMLKHVFDLSEKYRT